MADVHGPPGPVWDQGDVVNGVYFAAFDESKPAVLMTPSCDVEQGKVDLWTFIALFSDVDVARQLLQKDLLGWGAKPNENTTISKQQRSALEKKLRELIAQRFPRYHWIPVELGGALAHVADFACVTCVPAEEVRANSTRVCTLRSSWREQLPARYAAFMARVGTTDITPDDVAVHVERLAKMLLTPGNG